MKVPTNSPNTHSRLYRNRSGNCSMGNWLRPLGPAGPPSVEGSDSPETARLCLPKAIMSIGLQDQLERDFTRDQEFKKYLQPSPRYMRRYLFNTGYHRRRHDQTTNPHEKPNPSIIDQLLARRFSELARSQQNRLSRKPTVYQTRKVASLRSPPRVSIETQNNQ
jgi:hypothetical protein